jgi:cytochrome b561
MATAMWQTENFRYAVGGLGVIVVGLGIYFAMSVPAKDSNETQADYEKRVSMRKTLAYIAIAVGALHILGAGYLEYAYGTKAPTM